MINSIIENFKNIVTITIVLICSYFGYTAYESYKENQSLHKEIIGLQEDYKQVNDNVAKLKSEYQEQTLLLQKKEKEWKEIEIEKNEKIRLLSDATYLMGKHVGRQNGPDYYYETPKGTKNYIYNEIRISGEDSPPIGFVMIKNDGRTYKGNYEFEINVKNLQTIDEKTGKIKIYSKAFLIMKEEGLASKDRCKGCKNWKDIPFPLKIIGGEALIDPTTSNNTLKPKMYWWNPKFGTNISLGLDNRIKMVPSLETSLMSYGATKNDSKFKFAGFGVSLGSNKEDIDFHLSPIYWRPFDLFGSTYIVPSVGYTLEGYIRFLLGVHLQF